MEAKQWTINDMSLPARKVITVWAGDVEILVKQVEKGKHYAIQEVPQTAKVARLIAASPTMHKKLTDTVAWLDREIEDLGDAQGEWVAVQDTFAPDWVQFYKDAVDRLKELRDDLAETLRKIEEGV